MTTGNQSLQFGDYTVTIVVSDPPWYQNCFIVQKGQGGEQVVIDPGAEPSRVVEQIEANGGKATDVLLTHGHPDHISGVRGCKTLWIFPAMPIPMKNRFWIRLPPWLR